MSISSDGYIRLSYPELQAVPLVHLISGLDEDPSPASCAAATATAIVGYTEWASSSPPVISLGWDWRLETPSCDIRLRKCGNPRSNLMLQDSSHVDIGPRKTGVLLEALIETMDWQETVKQHICKRYGG